MNKVDPITRSVVHHRLTAIVAEMGEAMLRTAYSQILNSSRDFSVAICNRDCELVAQADHIPIHVGALPFATEAVEKKFPAVSPGDVIILNDPYHGGSHLPDITAFVPVFSQNEHSLWIVVRAHFSDIGGATYGGYNPEATEIWQEGIRIPPVKLYRAGELQEDFLDTLALNVRNPRDFRGDLAAMIGAAHLGERQIINLFGEMGTSKVLLSIAELLDTAEQQARSVLAGWRDGVFHGVATLDDDGHGREDINIVAKVTKSGTDIEVDLSESDEQTASFMNSSFANTQSAVLMAFAYLIDPDISKNSGAFRPVKVVLKPGTIVWATRNAAVTMCTAHPADQIVEAIVRAMSHCCPDRAMAGWSRRFRLAIQGTDPRSGRDFIWHLFHARPGGGASSAGDGWSSAGEWHTVGGTKFGSIEVAEVRFPFLFRKHEFRPGSGGQGKYRGGLGVDLDLVINTSRPAVVNTSGDGRRHGACGLLGGHDGVTHDYSLISDGHRPRALMTKEAGVEIRPGDLLRIRSAGGGGWGDPGLRSPEMVETDRRLGLM